MKQEEVDRTSGCWEAENVALAACVLGEGEVYSECVGRIPAFKSRGTIVDLICLFLAAASLLRLSRAPTPGKLCTDSGPMPNPRTGSQQALAQS